MNQFLFAAVAVVVGALVALNRWQWLLTHRTRKRHPDAFFLERADFESEGKRQKAGYLVVAPGSLSWTTMRGESAGVVSSGDGGVAVTLKRRGFVPGAGAVLEVETPDRSLRLLTFKRKALSSALAQAGFVVEQA